MVSRIIIVGNCQAEQLARCVGFMLPDYIVDYVPYSSKADYRPILARSPDEVEFVFIQSPVMKPVAEAVRALQERFTTQTFPTIAYTGFHPDLIRPKIDGRVIGGPLGSNHSAIVMRAFLHGLDEGQAAALFNAELFEALGYTEHKRLADVNLVQKLKQCRLFDAQEYARIQAIGCFMHCTLHPKLAAIAALARMILRSTGLSPKISFVDRLMADDMATKVVWPVYPPLAAQLDLEPGEYVFQHRNRPGDIFDLPQFVEACFAHYRAEPFDSSVHVRLSDPAMDIISHFLTPAPSAHRQPASDNPYSGLSDYHFWRRAVATVDDGDLDPVVQPRLRLTNDTKVATAGSCFAQHIARRLAESGHRYLVTETGDDLHPDERRRRNYGVFSARYGNVYTVRQLVQLIDRAYGRFDPQDSVWRRHDGLLIDPFRPEIEPDGFADVQSLLSARAEHLAAVRALIEQTDIFVFTLGLTEGWVARADGAAFPLCPGVVASDVDMTAYAFVNFTAGEIAADLRAAIELMRNVNPDVRILLTVSPVPLIATYENRHVMVSTMASKAILRAAADEIQRSVPNVDYFPSYEIIANPFTENCYYEPDRRSVSARGVDHVMRVFMRHYSDSNRAPGNAGAPAGASVKTAALAAEIEQMERVVCEEDRLDP